MTRIIRNILLSSECKFTNVDYFRFPTWNEDGYFILWLRGGLMSYFSVQFCPQWSDALQNWRSWGSILFLKGAVFSVLTEASRVTQTGKRRSKEGWFCSRKSRSDWFLVFPGIQGQSSDEPRMPRGTWGMFWLWGTFPPGFLPSLFNIFIESASEEI